MKEYMHKTKLSIIFAFFKGYVFLELSCTITFIQSSRKSNSKTTMSFLKNIYKNKRIFRLTASIHQK